MRKGFVTVQMERTGLMGDQEKRGIKEHKGILVHRVHRVPWVPKEVRGC